MTHVTATDVAAYAQGDASMWITSTGGVVVAVDEPNDCMLGLPPDPVWVEQWDGNWQAAADQLNQIATGRNL